MNRAISHQHKVNTSDSDVTVTVLVLVQCFELASINDVLTIITNNNTNNIDTNLYFRCSPRVSESFPYKLHNMH